MATMTSKIGILRSSRQARPAERKGSLLHDERGASLVLIGLSLPVLLSFVGLAVEVGNWYFVHERMQSAADAAALSAATSSSSDGGASISNTIKDQGKAVASSYSYTTGVGGATVTVNTPPVSGPNTATPYAVEVIIEQPQARLFSSIFSTGTVPISARAVAVGQSGLGCVLALSTSATGAISVTGSASTQLDNCNMLSNSTASTSVAVGNAATVSARAVFAAGGVPDAARITTTNGVLTHHAASADPYASVQMPSFSGCDYNNMQYKTVTSMSPGVYCGGVTFLASANVTMLPGVYYIDGGTFKMAGGATLSGSGVTIVFTSSTGSNYATASIQGGANLNLTAPSSGTFAGIAIFADRSIPTGTAFDLAGGSGQNIGGAIYLPTVALKYTGGASLTTNCTQVIGYTIAFTGNSGLKVDCSGYGTQNLGGGATKLVE